MANESDAQALLRTFTIYRDQLLSARDKAARDPGSWGGWSVRFNQRLRGVANRYGLLDESDGDADEPLRVAFESLRELWSEMNKTIAGQEAHVARARIAMESALIRARQSRMIGDERS